MTDPSYAGQIITFTFPHIGNVGANPEDIETDDPGGARLRHRAPTSPSPSNWRAAQHLDAWLKSHNLIGITGVDTRRLTRRIRDGGAPNGVIAHAPDGKLRHRCPDRRGHGLARPRGHGPRQGRDLPPDLRLGRDALGSSAAASASQASAALPRRRHRLRRQAQHPALPRRRRLPRDGGAGDRDGRGRAAPQARRHLPLQRPRRSGRDRRLCRAGDPRADRRRGMPIFGICLGHQMLASRSAAGPRRWPTAIAAPTIRSRTSPTGKVEITSQNHGFVRAAGDPARRTSR